MNAAVVVMAKAPRPGTVKTRLTPMLGTEGCAALATALIRQAMTSVRATSPAAAYLAFDPADAAGEMASLAGPGVGLVPQRGAGLGERLAAATAEALAKHGGPVLVIGTDVPTLTPTTIQAAAGALHADVDVVFGPALDGGYYLVGLRDPWPGLFALEPHLWGGPDVLAASVAAAQTAGARVGFLEVLRDLDTPADAGALLSDPALPSGIAMFLRAAA